jgi:hypothetical protein
MSDPADGETTYLPTHPAADVPVDEIIAASKGAVDDRAPSITPARAVAQRGVDRVRQPEQVAKRQRGIGLERVWADGGYHGFSVDDGLWSVISSAGQVLTSDTPDSLISKIRAHWQVMQ